MSFNKTKSEILESDVDDLMDTIFGNEEEPSEHNDEDDEDDDNDEDNDNDNEEDDNDSTEQDQQQLPFHIPYIDPDAVDFEPLFQDHSSVPVNYHDVSHGDTEHHRLLHKKSSSIASKAQHPDPDSEPESQLELGSMWNNLLRMHPSSVMNKLVYKCQEGYYSMPQKHNKHSRKKHRPEEVDYMRYVALGMLGFIFYVLLSHMNQASEAFHLDGNVITKTNTVSQHSSNNNPFSSHAPEDTLIPKEYDNYRNVDDLPIGLMDTPIYWHVPRSAGTTMKLILSMCMGRVVACEQGAGHQLDEQLEILNKPFGNFANVDTSTPLGLERAAEIGLIPARLVDVVLTPHVRDAGQLFDVHHKGRIFGMFRDPIERIESLYYFLRMPDQEAAMGMAVNEMTLIQFATDFSENWMVRSLVGTMVGHIDSSHLNIAKRILKTKFLIGLLEEKTESLRRIETYFGWRLPSRVSQTCKNNMYYFEPQSKNVHPTMDRTSEDYDALLAINLYDIQLYQYAKFLFQEQASLISK